MAKSGIKSGLRSARKQHIINNNNNESRFASTTSQTEATVKEEPINEEYKDFAETAMNELLGWYGYGSSVARDSGATEKSRPGSYKSNSNSSSSPVSPLHANGCGWCGKLVDENNGLLSGQSSFCSELCFSQSRRANFKKNKTCDWCRHVRHTVSYVDFQEGSAQLQFCSDKCLNQYKMHIFCRETQAHLEFHPHLVAGDSSAGGSGNIGLITPDLWLRDCKTPPDEDSVMDHDRVNNRSPNLMKGPSAMKTDKVEESPRKGCSIDTVPKLIPIITLAPTSSLLASTSGSSIKLIKKSRNKRKRFSSATITSQSTPNTSTSSTNSLLIDEDVAQDLRVRHNITPPPTQNQQSNPPKINASSSSSSPVILTNREDINPTPKPIAFPPTTKPPSNINQQQQPANISMIPPVTVLVPYPIMVPVPLPIPIPLPVSSFLRAYFGAKAAFVTTDEASSVEVESGAMAPVRAAEEEEEIVVDVVAEAPKSPRMLRRRKKMLGSAKVIRKKI